MFDCHYKTGVVPVPDIIGYFLSIHPTKFHYPDKSGCQTHVQKQLDHTYLL